MSKCSNKFEFFSDSDFAGDRQITKKSRSGVLITLNNIPVHWRSATQPKTVYSPAAAEIYALREAVRDGRSVLWVCRDLHFSGVSFPFVVQVDSDGADSFAKDTCVRSRHRGDSDMAEGWVQELKSGEVVKTQWIPNRRQKADILTKCLSSKLFQTGFQLVSALQK